LLTKFLRESTTYARLLHHRAITGNETIMSNWMPKMKTFAHRLFYRMAEWFGEAIRDYDRLVGWEAYFEKRVANSKAIEAFTHFLKSEKPDLLFNTHQRAIEAIPAMAAARKEGIPTAEAIFSWDNLPKAKLWARADRYVVWSEYMKEEMRRYYPEISKESVHVTGTPQFEFYADTSFYESKEEFCKRFGLDPKRKIVCYSGDDRLTSPYDPEYLADLAKALMNVSEARRPQILFRRCPADFSDRYDRVLEKYRELIHVADPLWNRDNGEHWALFYPDFEDVKVLVNIALHCDTVYNVGSTMAHDFAMFDKPACYIRYDQPHSKGWSVDTIYRFEHFKSMEGLDAVVWVDSKTKIGEKVLEAIESPQSVAKDRKRWLQKIIGSEPEKASENMIKVLSR